MLSSLFLLSIYCYQVLLSPFFGGHCRFHPSCSNYAREAFQNKGFAEAFTLVLLRLLKCQPFGPFGDDPVIGDSLYDRKQQ